MKAQDQSKIEWVSVIARDRRFDAFSKDDVLLSYNVNDIEHYDDRKPFNWYMNNCMTWGTRVEVPEGMLYLVRHFIVDGHIVTAFNSLDQKYDNK